METNSPDFVSVYAKFGREKSFSSKSEPLHTHRQKQENGKVGVASCMVIEKGLRVSNQKLKMSIKHQCGP